MAWVDWTWDPDKNRENIRKHGFDFQDAVDVFDDQSNIPGKMTTNMKSDGKLSGRWEEGL